MDNLEEALRGAFRTHYLCGFRDGMLDALFYAKSVEQLFIDQGKDT